MPPHSPAGVAQVVEQLTCNQCVGVRLPPPAHFPPLLVISWECSVDIRMNTEMQPVAYHRP